MKAIKAAAAAVDKERVRAEHIKRVAENVARYRPKKGEQVNPAPGAGASEVSRQ